MGIYKNLTRGNIMDTEHEMTHMAVQAFLMEQYGFKFVQPVFYTTSEGGVHVFGIDPETGTSLQFPSPFKQSLIVDKINKSRKEWRPQGIKYE